MKERRTIAEWIHYSITLGRYKFIFIVESYLRLNYNMSLPLRRRLGIFVKQLLYCFVIDDYKEHYQKYIIIL